MGRAQRRQVTIHDAFTHGRQPSQLLADLDGFYNLEARIATSGEVPERPIGPVSKTGVAATSPRVRIPPSPLDYRNRPSTKTPQGLLRVKAKFTARSSSWVRFSIEAPRLVIKGPVDFPRPCPEELAMPVGTLE